MANQDDKTLLIDSKTGNGVEGTWTDYQGEEHSYEFDGAYSSLQDGAFIGFIENEDGNYLSALFDGSTAEPIYSLNSPVYMTDYRDDLIIARSDDRYYLLPAHSDYGTEHRLGYSADDYDMIRSSYGTVFCGYNKYSGDLHAFSWTFDTKALIDTMNSDAWESLENEADLDRNIYTYNDGKVYIWPNAANKEGWVRATVDYDVVENDGTLSVGDSTSGYFNIKTNEFVETPDGNVSCSYFTDDNGCNVCTVTDSRAALAVDETGGGGSVYRIFDLSTGDYVSEERYLTIGSFGYHTLVLVENEDEKWGYINDGDASAASDWYDDATDFCNGYAIVTENGKARLIDENLQTVSEEFDAESASTVADYVTFSDLNGKSVFFINDGEKVHFATVE